MINAELDVLDTGMVDTCISAEETVAEGNSMQSVSEG